MKRRNEWNHTTEYIPGNEYLKKKKEKEKKNNLLTKEMTEEMLK